MVQLHVKKSDQERFLFETTVEAPVRDVLREVVEVHNLRMRIHRLKLEGEELAKYGPAKPLDKQVRSASGRGGAPQPQLVVAAATENTERRIGTRERRRKGRGRRGEAGMGRQRGEK